MSRKINTPLTAAVIAELKTGEEILLSGTIYTARDAAHKRLSEMLTKKEPWPVDLKDQIIYYVGPTPATQGRPIGSAGPTTSDRMDNFTPMMLEAGLKGVIGKGPRSQTVKESLVQHQAVYFAAIGGAGALLSKCITSAEVVAFPDLGTEAIHKLTVKDFPVIVINDIYGHDLYTER